MSQQYNATFNLQSNVAAQLGAINQGIQGLNRQLQGLEGTAKNATKPVDQLGKAFQQMASANIGQTAADIKSFSSSVRSLDKITGKVQGVAQTLKDLNRAFTKSGAANVRAYADAVAKLASNLRIAADAAKDLAKQGVKLGRAPTPTGVPATTKATAKTSKLGFDPATQVKGAFQPVRSKETAKSLAAIGSAAQGASIGMALLQRNLTGVMFGIIFMQFGLVKIIALFAALTIAVGVAVGGFLTWISVVTKAASVGIEFERRGQQMASWLRSGDMAAQVYRFGEEMARTFGVATDDATELAFTLAKTGQMTSTYAKGILNIAAANGESIAEVGHRWNAIMMADSEARAGLVERFARDYGLPIRTYTDAIDLATEANKRFEGSAEAAANTSSGMWGKVKANVASFMISMGKIVNEIIKPFFELMIGFTDGLVEGFNTAFEAAGGADGAKMSLDGLRDSVRKLIPWVVMLGNLIGRFLFWSLQKLVQVIKFVTGALNAALKFWKEYRDEVKTAGRSFVTNFIDVLSSPEVIIAALGTFVTTFISGLISAFAKGAFGELGTGIWGGIMSAIKTVPKSFFEGFVEGLKKGLITALFEAFLLTVVEMLPISESLRDSLNGIIRLAFLGGAIGSVIPGIGTTIGAAIAIAIGIGFEMMAPGSIKKAMDTLDGLILDGLQKGGKALQTFYKWLTDDGTKVWDTNDNNIIDSKEEYEAYTDSIANKHTPRIVVAWTTIQEGVMKAIGTVTDFIKGPVMDVLRELWEWIDGPTKRAWETLQKLWDGPVKQVLGDLQPMFEDLLTILTFLWEKVIDTKVTWAILEFFWKVNMYGTIILITLAMAAFHVVLEALLIWANRFFLPLWNTLKDSLDLIANLCEGDWSAAWGSLKNIIVDLITFALSPFLGLLDVIELITGVDISAGIVAGFGYIKDAVVGAANVISGIDFVGGFLGAVQYGINSAITLINGLITAYNNTIGRIPKGPGKIGYIDPVNITAPVYYPGASVDYSSIGLTGMQHGGRVPGPAGTKRLVLAEAGEYFGGAPEFANADGRHRRGGGNGDIYLDLRGAIISDDAAMDKFVLKIGNTIAGTWFSTRRMTLPRSG